MFTSYKVMSMSNSQFCGTFFHVPQIRVGPENVCMKHCLDGSCKVGRLPNPKRQPRTVDALVVIKTETNMILETNMYHNCCLPSTTIHAEEFFYEDVKHGMLSNSLPQWSSAYGSLEICMYITYQPCHFSTRKTPRKSCSDQMVKLFVEVLKPMNIKFVIKPCLIYKAYWDPRTADRETQQEIINAKNGIRRLFAAGIDIRAMEKRDWIFLRDRLCPSSRICTLHNHYEGSEREKLDFFILENIIIEIMSCVENAVQETEETLSLSRQPVDPRYFYMSTRTQALPHSGSRLQKVELGIKIEINLLRYYLSLIDSIYRDMQIRRKRMHERNRSFMPRCIYGIEKHIQEHLQQMNYHKGEVLDYLRNTCLNHGYTYLNFQNRPSR